jgi:phage terminase Nu1 subunit (DNA packaging protein)
VGALTLKALAKGCNVSERTLNTWIARGCPRESIKAAQAWRDEHILPRKGGPKAGRPAADPAQQSLLARRTVAQCEKDEAAARREQLKSDQLERLVIYRDQVVREAGEIFAAVRAILETIPDGLAKEFPQKLRARAYEVGKNKVDIALRKLADLHLVGGAADGA